MKLTLPHPREEGQESDITRPDKNVITEAARTLARLRIHPRQFQGNGKWTGRLFGHRVPVGLPVTLPNGRTGWIKCIQRGIACVKTEEIDPVDGPIHDYLSAAELRPYKMPQAVLLGGLKLGKTERRSAAKAAASRRNGAKPPRPGSRRRGRPRKGSNAPELTNSTAPLYPATPQSGGAGGHPASAEALLTTAEPALDLPALIKRVRAQLVAWNGRWRRPIPEHLHPGTGQQRRAR